LSDQVVSFSGLASGAPDDGAIQVTWQGLCHAVLKQATKPQLRGLRFLASGDTGRSESMTDNSPEVLTDPAKE
jgi:hypothetical protein